MSDIGSSVPAADAVADAIDNQGAAVGQTVDWEARFNKEVADRIRERNLYKPVQQALRDLDEGSVAEITRLADMARRGDTAGIVDWSLATAQNVAQKDIAQIIAERQGTTNQPFQQQQPQQVPNGFQQTPTTPVDPDTIRRMVAEGTQNEVRVQMLVQQINSELTAAGHDPTGPGGQTIIRYAQATNVPIKDAISWYNNDALAKIASRQQALQTTAGQTPQLSPTGAAPGSAPADLSPRDKAMLRLRAGANGPQ